MTHRSDVAVVGLGALFPGAPDARRFWSLVASGRSALAEASEARLDPAHDLPTRRGGFVPDALPFDAGAFGVMPVAAAGAEPDQLLVLQVAADCLRDARQVDLDRSRVGVILGRGGYLTPGMVRLSRHAREADQLEQILRRVLPDAPATALQEVRQAFLAQAGPYGPDTAIGLVPNLAASRVANRLDLRGPAYTVDAACASALVAVDHACTEIASGRCDLVLAGAVHLTHDVSLWSVFTQLGALSRSEAVRPFDARADGLLIGEGVGLLALKSAERAAADGDRIYAVIRGVGIASDGRATSVMVPRSEGQLLAMRRAWEGSGLDPSAVGWLEAHGTGTPVGDAVEVASLAEMFGPAGDAPRAGLGSVKAQIGHAMPAAGAAGLIKAVLAVHHGVLPPTVGCDEPVDALASTRFAPNPEARAWEGARVAAVNAFGFGGINGHVVLQQHGPSRRAPRLGNAVADRDEVEVLTLAAADPEALLAALEAVRQGRMAPTGAGPCRLALLDPTPERLERARATVQRGADARGRGGIWFRRRGLLSGGGKLAFVFPGIEATFLPDLRGLDATGALRHADTVEGDLEATGLAVVALGRRLLEALGTHGITPDVVAGHSIGEWTAMVATGMVAPADADTLIASLRPGSLEVPDVLFAAVGAGAGVATEALEGLRHISISHDNCPHQVILCGRADAIEVARTRLVERGVLCQVLPFRSGFHSPLFAEHLQLHREHMQALPLSAPQVPLYSATLAAPYPSDPGQVRRLMVDHLVQPVRFRALVERLYDDGVRVFLQLGQGSVPGFVGDTLADRPHLALSASEERRSHAAQLRTLRLALFVEGLGQAPAAEERLQISLCTPSVAVGRPLGTSAPALEGADPMAAALRATTAALTAGAADVVQALRQTAPAPREVRIRRTLSVAEIGALRDHSFFPQAPGWTALAELDPVVPLTFMVEMLADAAQQLHPDRAVVALTELRATRWLRVHPPAQVQIVAREAADGWVDVALEGYASARVQLVPEERARPASTMAPLASPAAPPHDAATIYAERYMFHGPAYQGITAVRALDDGGLDGDLVALPAPGALLDAAGQLAGYWLMATHATDQLTLPTGVRAIRWFGPAPAVGEQVPCRVRVVAVDAQQLVADIELGPPEAVWCTLSGWADHRFASDARVLDAMRLPERHVLSEDVGGFSVFLEERHRAPSRDWLARRTLTEAERAQMTQTPPRQQRAFLNQRIAAKDAVRRWLWQAGHGPIFPAQITLSPDLRGATAPGGERVAVATAAAPRGAVALAGDRAEAAPLWLLEQRPTERDLRGWLAAARGVALDPSWVVRSEDDGAVVDGAVVGVRSVFDHVVLWRGP
ncbi:MAG: polyketide synthase dehydratase domain-containing protein [Myxococcales bacterium]|nr:polyketide synthase dehydratase domain-containing protein [Myxococcales bacterium]